MKGWSVVLVACLAAAGAAQEPAEPEAAAVQSREPLGSLLDWWFSADADADASARHGGHSGRSSTGVPPAAAPAAPQPSAPSSFVQVEVSGYFDAVADVRFTCSDDVAEFCAHEMAAPRFLRRASRRLRAAVAGGPADDEDEEEEASADRTAAGREAALGLGSFEADRCLRRALRAAERPARATTHQQQQPPRAAADRAEDAVGARAISPPCRAAVERVDLITAALPPGARLAPPPHGPHVCHSLVVGVLVVIGLLTVLKGALRCCCMLAHAGSIGAFRKRRRNMKRIIDAIRANPELQKAVEDAAGVELPPACAHHGRGARGCGAGVRVGMLVALLVVSFALMPPMLVVVAFAAAYGARVMRARARRASDRADGARQELPTTSIPASAPAAEADRPTATPNSAIAFVGNPTN